MTAVEIIKAQELEPTWIATIEDLLRQLSTTAKFDRSRLDAAMSSEGVDVFLALSGGIVVGMSFLAHYPTLSGLRAHIEDVVVAHDQRGRGIGGDLVRAMLEEAKKLGCRTVELTSRPSRSSAVRLYKRAGFAVRDTLLFRHSLQQEDRTP